jgi:4'-phosphopantetheinyl transferase
MGPMAMPDNDVFVPGEARENAFLPPEFVTGPSGRDSDMTIDIEEWTGAPSNGALVLLEDQVKVWYRELSCDALDLPVLFEILSLDERERAQRFQAPKAKYEFVLTRGTLRMLLGSALGKHPNAVRFEYSDHGKPALGASEHSDLRFSVSHAEGIALFAFARSREVGVDIEFVERSGDLNAIAERFFSAREKETLRELSGSDSREAFFRCWTRKEAYIKARGEGLSIPLDQFDVSILKDKPPQLLATRPDPEEAARWSLHELTIRPGYVAALAVAADVDIRRQVRRPPSSAPAAVRTVR